LRVQIERNPTVRVTKKFLHNFHVLVDLRGAARRPIATQPHHGKAAREDLRRIRAQL